MMKRTLAIVICILLSIAFLASCSYGGDKSAPMDNAYSQPQASAAPPAGSGSSGANSAPSSSYADSSAPSSGGYSSEESLLPLPILAPSEANGKKLVYTVTLRLQTTEFMKGMRKLNDTAGSVGGYITYANVQGHDIRYPEVERKADYQFRIPSERLTEFLIVIEDNYNLWSLLQTTDDVTTRYDSSGDRLEDLLAQEQRLLDDLAKEEDSSERLSIERKLSEVQTRINELTSFQASVDDSVLYSTVIIELYEVIFPPIEEEEEPVPPPTFGEKLAIRIQTSVEAFVAFCQGGLLILITIAPGLIVLAILAILAYIIYRIVKWRKKAKKIASRPVPAPDTESERPGT